MLTTIADNLKPLPLQEPLPVQRGEREAAVLLALTMEPRPHLVLTRRAGHLNDHAGEVALPGGMWEPQDSSLLHTALRESHEEIGLPPGEVELFATLPPRDTRLGVRVTPFVGRIAADAELTPELAELDAIFRVPLEYLLDTNNLTRANFDINGKDYSLPCYQYQEYTIWGFTLALLVEFLNCSLRADIQLKYPAIKNFPQSRPEHTS
ncbi:CoA pyrophosphatase [Porticoccus sp. W117]|uniref:CoA pyrophosphatase n=1 Tax=Porticoccus sp. W117 TaxID=3054777 RepID=UPI00259A29AD|nr:CoA pyrophosphatase [Porticoccus sp. W117]MDM3872162.1 CoA pyrophosphatase [Porticoccus sp. W117]